jgi:hypothetical protein
MSIRGYGHLQCHQIHVSRTLVSSITISASVSLWVALSAESSQDQSVDFWSRRDDVPPRRSAQASVAGALPGTQNWTWSSIIASHPPPLSSLNPITTFPSNTYHHNHEGNYSHGHRYRGWHRLRRRAQDAAEEGPTVSAAGKLHRMSHQWWQSGPAADPSIGERQHW